MEHLPNSALPLAEAIPVTQIKEAQFRFSNCRFEYELMIASDDMLKAIVDAGVVFQRAGLSCGQFRSGSHGTILFKLKDDGCADLAWLNEVLSTLRSFSIVSWATQMACAE